MVHQSDQMNQSKKQQIQVIYRMRNLELFFVINVFLVVI
jgi:hypothetical protein